MLVINDKISIALNEIEISATRAEGPGGQHVNKTSSAIHLRFNIKKSSLPDWVKVRLLKLKDHRITPAGDIIIKSKETRSLIRNKELALKRLKDLILKSMVTVKKRKATKPTKTSIKKRIDDKKNRGKLKKLRNKKYDE